jgi:hypothetical protein
MDGDRWIEGVFVKGDAGLECGLPCGYSRTGLPLPDCEPLFEAASSSRLSWRTGCMFWALRVGLLKTFDIGNRKPWSDFCDRVEPLVKVRGCELERYESTLLVKLGGKPGDDTPGFKVLDSTGSGDEALGAPTLK